MVIDGGRRPRRVERAAAWKQPPRGNSRRKETAAAWRQPLRVDSPRRQTAPAGRQQQQRVIAALTWLLAANGTSPG
jgi:hypothetical protein